MEGWDPLTGVMRAPRPGESLMAGPPETSPRQPRPPQQSGPKGLFHQFTEEERDDLLRQIGQSWLGPEEEEASATGERYNAPPIDVDQMSEAARRIFEGLNNPGAAGFMGRGAGAPIDPSGAHGGSPPRGIDHLMDEIDNVAQQYEWPEQEKQNAKDAIEAFMGDDDDLFYEDLALKWTGDLPGGHGIAYETNASGEFENDEVGVYYPETKETEYFTTAEWAAMMRG